MNILWENTNQDLLPNDENKKLPPMDDRWFDGERESREIKFNKCKHDLYAVSATEVKCHKCSSGWVGLGVTELLKTNK